MTVSSPYLTDLRVFPVRIEPSGSTSVSSLWELENLHTGDVVLLVERMGRDPSDTSMWVVVTARGSVGALPERCIRNSDHEAW